MSSQTSLVAERVRLRQWAAQIQFPWRWITFACLFAVLLIGSLLDDIETFFSKQVVKNTGIILGSLSLFMAMMFSGNYMASFNMFDMTETAQLNHSYEANEYMRYGAFMENVTHELQAAHINKLELLNRNAPEMKIYCKAMKGRGREVIFPVFNYKGYALRDDKGDICEIYDSPNKEIAFAVPAGYDGNYILTYEFPWYWRLGDIISLCSWIMLVVGSVYYQVRREKKHEDSIDCSLLQ